MFLMKLVITGSRDPSNNIMADYCKNYRGGYGGFRTDYLMTIGADFFLMPVRLEEIGMNVKLQVWRLSQSQRFATVRSLYHRGASGAIVTFDNTDFNSFQRVDEVVDECWRNSGRGMVPLAIVTSNTPDSERQVTADQIQDLVDHYETRTAGIDDPPNIRYFELEEDRQNQREVLEEMLTWMARKYLNIAQRSGMLVYAAKRLEEISNNVKEVINDLLLDDVTFDGEYIYVQGSRALYRISIQTKQVQAADTGNKICIVSKYSNRQQENPLLPFVPYESHHVAEIISKALLLLNDQNLPPDIESKVMSAIHKKKSPLFANLRG